MEVRLYGKKGCGICEAAAEKLKLLGVEFEKREIADYVHHHDGWESDGSVEVSSAFFQFDQRLPIIQIGLDFFTYADAMRRLKRAESEA